MKKSLVVLIISLFFSHHANAEVLCTPPIASKKGYTSNPSSPKYVAVNKYGTIATVGAKNFFGDDKNNRLSGILFHNTDLTANFKDYNLNNSGANRFIRALPNGDFIYGSNTKLYRIGTNNNRTLFRSLPGIFLTSLDVTKNWVYASVSVNSSGTQRLYRLDHNGVIDTSFNFTDTANGVSSIKKVIELPNGKVLMSRQRFGVLRLNSNGTIDNSFQAHVPVRGVLYSTPIIALQSDGKIVVSAGSGSTYKAVTSNGKTWRGIYRLHPNGRIDETFTESRIRNIKGTTLDGDGSIEKMLINDKDEIFLTGKIAKFNDEIIMNIVKLNPDGSFNQEFAKNTYRGTGGLHGFADMALQSDGKIVAVGPLIDGYLSFDHQGIVRFYPNGIVDTPINNEASNLIKACSGTATITKPYTQSCGKNSDENLYIISSTLKNKLVAYSLTDPEVSEQGFVGELIRHHDWFPAVYRWLDIDANGIIYTLHDISSGAVRTYELSAYDPSKKQTLWTTTTQSFKPFDMSVSDDGSKVAISFERGSAGLAAGVIFYDATNGDLLNSPTIKGKHRNIEFDLAGRYLYTAEFTNVRRYDTQNSGYPTKEPVLSLPVLGLGNYNPTEIKWVDDTHFLLYRSISNNNPEYLFRYTLNPTTGKATLDTDYATNGKLSLSRHWIWGRKDGFEVDKQGNAYLIGHAAQGSTGAPGDMDQNIIKVSPDGKTVDYQFIPYHGFDDRHSGKMAIGPNLFCEKDKQCAIATGDVSEVNIAVESKIIKDNLLIVPSTTLAPSAGHITAFKLKEDGTQSATASWDAAAQMTTTNRRQKLMTHNGDLQLTLLNQMSASSLGVDTQSKAATIKEYTFNPAYQNGTFLEGRDPNSLLGAISRGHIVKIVSNIPQRSRFLKDADYRDFAQSYITKRPKHVLFTSDDGFLYNVDYNSGNLVWGWTPASVANQLKNIKGFTDKHWMRGDVHLVDAKNSSGHYNSYIVGSYLSGLGHYVLQYDKQNTQSASLKTIIQDDDYRATYKQGVNNGSKQFITDSNGLSYMIFAMTKADNKTTLFIQGIGNPLLYQIELGSNLSSELLITNNYHSRYAPAPALYLGMKDGTVLSTPLLTSSGELQPQSIISQKLAQPNIATMNATGEGITHLGIVKQGKYYYLRSQTKTQLTLHRYDANLQKWLPRWTTFVEGAGTWDNNGTYTASTNSSASFQGDHPIIPSDGTQALPTNALISAEAYMINGHLILPVTVESEESCHAYYYLFSIEEGVFPKNSIQNINGTITSTHINLGHGMASSIEMADNPSQSALIGYGNVDQNNDNSVGTPETFIIKDSAPTGIRSWRIVE